MDWQGHLLGYHRQLFLHSYWQKTHTAEQHGSPQRGSRVAVAATTRARL